MGILFSITRAIPYCTETDGPNQGVSVARKAGAVGGPRPSLRPEMHLFLSRY